MTFSGTVLYYSVQVCTGVFGHEQNGVVEYGFVSSIATFTKESVMAKKDKHVRLSEYILQVLDQYALKTQRTKTVVYEMALKEFAINNKEDLVKLGISSELIEKAINSDFA